MSERTDTLIIGGGQAGLALSFYLSQQGRAHLVLEQADRLAEAWRNHRWDSFTLVTPNWTMRMPGAEYSGDDPDGFTPRDRVVQYFERYAEQFKVPVRFNTRATNIVKTGAGFRVETTQGNFDAANVVIATGSFQNAKLPAYRANIPATVRQLHTGEYRNPDALPPGAILVAGTGQSGCQIAEELYQSGRTVYLSTGTAPRAPRRYRGKDIVYWLNATGFFDQTVDQLPSPRAKYASNPQVTGKDGGHTLDLHKFARDGVILLGRIQGAQNGQVTFAADLYENLKFADRTEAEIVKNVDGYIERHGLDAPPETLSGLRDGYDSEIITELDLAGRGITTVIWAMGYTFDYTWIPFPVFDADGFPIQTRGVSAVPGLYFLGMNWLYNRRSALLFGIAGDAEHLAGEIAARGALN